MTSTQPTLITLTQPPAGLYDSLPYIDLINFDENPQLKASVAALVSQELQSSSKRRYKDFVRYVDHIFPTPPHSFITTTATLMMQHDIEHYEKTKQLPQHEKQSYQDHYIGFDHVIPPAPADLTPSEWIDELNALKTSINYYRKHLIHLELHREFGKEQWVHGIQDTSTQIKQYQTQIKILQDNIEYANKVRKYRQDQVEEQFTTMKTEANNMIDENVRLQQEIYQQSQHKRQRTSL